MKSVRTWRRPRLIAAVAALAVIAVTLSMTLSMPSARAGMATRASSTLMTKLRTCQSPGRPKPTVVLVHGAWADPSSWNGEVTALERAGYVARATANPLRNLTTDAETVANFLKTISGPIVLVGHSYGGSVITNAAAGDKNVKALVYVDAAAPAAGETTAQLSGSGSALGAAPDTLYDKVPYPGAPAGATDLYLKENVFTGSFANDLPRSIAIRLWATQSPASTSAFMTPSKYAAWKTIPSWYVISTGDKIITLASELSMAHRAHSKITLFHGGSHLTLVSHPDAVTSVITSAICSVH